MKTMPRKLVALIATLSAVAALTGCAATQQQGSQAAPQGGISQEEHQAHHPQGTAAQPSAATGAGTAGRQGGMMGGQGGMMGGQGGMMGGQGGMMGGQGGMMGGQGGMMGGQGGMMGGQGGMMGGQGGMMGGQGGQMDMKSMCDMYERMKNARTPQERGAMMNENMKNMTPEMRQRQFEMMEQRCK